MALSRTSKIVLIIGGILFLFLVIGIVGVLLMAKSLANPSVPENSVLVLNVSGDLPEEARPKGESVVRPAAGADEA